MLDFHGTFVTPGHVYWCAGGTFAGRFAPLIDILRDDGVIQHQDGTLIRAATGCAVGSPDDAQFRAFLTREDPDGDRIIDKRQLRIGTRWMLPDGRHVSMREYMAGIGVEPQPNTIDPLCRRIVLSISIRSKVTHRLSAVVGQHADLA